MVVKYLPFIFVKITCIGSMGQLHFDSSFSELRYLASKTFFSESPFARMITGLMKYYLLVVLFLLLVRYFRILLKCQVIFLPCHVSESVLYLLFVF